MQTQKQIDEAEKKYRAWLLNKQPKPQQNMNQSLLKAHSAQEIKASKPFEGTLQDIQNQGFSNKDKENATLLIIGLAIGGLGCILALIAELF